MPKPIPYENGYRVNFTHEGQKHRRKFPTEELAQKYIDKVTKPKKTTSKLIEDINDYIYWSEKVKQKSWTWVRDLRMMLYFFAEHSKVKSTQDISFNVIRDYQVKWFRLNPDYSLKTWDMYRVALSSFLNWMNKRDTSIINYASDLEFKVKVQDNPADTYEPEEIEKIFAYLKENNYEMYRAFNILLYTGMRLGELVKLKTSDCDFKSKIKTIRCGTKTKETRTIPLPDKLLPLIKSRSGKYIIDNGKGQPGFNHKTYNSWLNKALFICDIPKGRHVVHSFRHTYARRLIEAGVDLPLVQKLMGHADIRTTMRYAKHFSLDRAYEAVNRL